MAIGLINPETSIGRDSGDIATLDPETSSRHAVVEVAEDGSVWLIDCGSRNGTFTEGNAIDGRTQLSDRQEFTCGNSGFMLVIG
jgi:adenylate cyclase